MRVVRGAATTRARPRRRTRAHRPPSRRRRRRQGRRAHTPHRPSGCPWSPRRAAHGTTIMVCPRGGTARNRKATPPCAAPSNRCGRAPQRGPWVCGRSRRALCRGRSRSRAYRRARPRPRWAWPARRPASYGCCSRGWGPRTARTRCAAPGCGHRARRGRRVRASSSSRTRRRRRRSARSLRAPRTHATRTVRRPISSRPPVGDRCLATRPIAQRQRPLPPRPPPLRLQPRPRRLELRQRPEVRAMRSTTWPSTTRSARARSQPQRTPLAARTTAARPAATRTETAQPAARTETAQSAAWIQQRQTQPLARATTAACPPMLGDPQTAARRLPTTPPPSPLVTVQSARTGRMREAIRRTGRPSRERRRTPRRRRWTTSTSPVHTANRHRTERKTFRPQDTPTTTTTTENINTFCLTCATHRAPRTRRAHARTHTDAHNTIPGHVVTRDRRGNPDVTAKTLCQSLLAT